MKKKELPRFKIDRKPTVADPHGCYEYIGKDGRYYGHWYVGRNWAGERFVASADPRDGLPWS